MPINLENYKEFIKEKGIEMVPYEIALEAQLEKVDKTHIDNTVTQLNKALEDLKNTVGDITL